MIERELQLLKDITELAKLVSRLKGENEQLKERVAFLERIVMAERQAERPDWNTKLIGEEIKSPTI